MQKDKLVEELARAIWLDRFRDEPWEGANTYDREDYRGHTRAMLSRLDALGLAIVPKEPSEAMIEAGHVGDPLACDVEDAAAVYPRIYRAMLSASSKEMAGL